MKFRRVPQKFFTSRYRKDMWENAKKIVKKVEGAIPVKRAYVMGSFSTRKKRPGDVDFIILLQVPEKDKKVKWCVDLVIAPDNKYGEYVLKDEDSWVKSRYGLKRSTMLRIK